MIFSLFSKKESTDQVFGKDVSDDKPKTNPRVTPLNRAQSSPNKPTTQPKTTGGLSSKQNSEPLDFITPKAKTKREILNNAIELAKIDAINQAIQNKHKLEAERKKASGKTPSSASKLRPSSIMNIEVGSGGVESVIEEAAILYANGQADLSMALLSNAIHNENINSQIKQIWLMLFDLYRIRDMKQEFEALALEFVVRLEESPPLWTEKQQKDRSTVTENKIFLSFTKKLSSETIEELNQYISHARQYDKLYIECSTLEAITPEECASLLKSFQAIKKLNLELSLAGKENLLKLLQDAIASSVNKNIAAIWLLLLELYQICNKPAEFEETALEYAVTFEVSPPSWETNVTRKAVTAQQIEKNMPTEEEFLVNGEILGGSDILTKQLIDYSAGRNHIIINLEKVQSIDFISAGMFLNVLTRLKHHGKSLRIKGVNEMIFALFGVMGFHQYAEIVKCKY